MNLELHFGFTNNWNRLFTILYRSNFFIVFLVVFTMNPYGNCQTDSIYIITRIQSIQFDGKVDEAVWESITPVPMVQYSPDAGSAPTERTEIRFAYNDEYFYASIRAFDSSPGGIRGNSLYRDRIAGSDHFEIILDTYNDNETAYIFNTIPTGVRTDASISNDATGSTISSFSWLNFNFNTFWDSKVTRDVKGWYAEIRVPFSSLRFQSTADEVIMGLSVQRKIARKLERLVYPNIPPEIDWAFLKPSLAQKILFTGIRPTKTIYISPYLLGGLNRTNSLNETQKAYDWDNDLELELGGDVKFSITNNLTVDATLNTDFAQVEADDQLVNLTRFSLFFPEKRQFFQERSAIFQFQTGGLSRLFFSRRIGLTEDGLQVPIIGGVRLVGRMNTWDLGILNMHTQKFTNIGAENFGVFRVKRRVLNANSTIGGIFTSRVEKDGQRNFAYGIDGLIKIFGDDYLSVNWSQTFDRNKNDNIDEDDSNNGRVTIEMNRRRRYGFGYNFGFIYSGKNYNPQLGFVDRNNFKFGTSSLSHSWLYDEGSTFIWQKIDFTGSAYWDNIDNVLLSAEAGPKWSFSTRTQDTGLLGFQWIYENLLEEFDLFNNVSVPIGDYSFARLTASYKMAIEKIVRAGVTVETGTFYDGWLHSITVNPSWFVSKHLELGLQYAYNQASFSNRNESFKVHIARLRIGTAVNTKLSTNAFVQYNSDLSVFSANVRFRYNIREGNDLWFVLNENLNTDRFSYSPSLPLSNGGSVFLKYVYTFLVSK